MQIKKSLIALSLILIATSAHAASDEREGAYVFGGLGKTQGNWKIPKAEAIGDVKRKQSDSRTSYAIGGGYRFGQHLAAEASFHDMRGGKSSKSKGAIDGQSVRIGGLALLPIGEHVELFGKVAVGSHRDMFTAASDGKPQSVRQRKWATTPSLGANVYLTESMALRAEYSLPTPVSKKVRQAAGADSMRFNAWNVGVAYSF